VAFGPDNRLFTFSRHPQRIRAFRVTDGGGTTFPANEPIPTGEPGIEKIVLPPGDGGVSFADAGTPWQGFEESFIINMTASSVRDTAHNLFHADVGSGLSCASCHGELTDDGHVWNFSDIGRRRTQNMRGGFLGTEPFHWEGDMKTFGHLVDEVMTGRMGGFEVEPAFADAVAKWIDVQPALQLAPRDENAVARGEALFASDETLCSSCHAGASRTDNANHDVGTGEALQTTSLRGLGLRAPYMHDGCAKSLKARFNNETCGGGDRHGRTSQLSDEELDDLVAYLKTL